MKQKLFSLKLVFFTSLFLVVLFSAVRLVWGFTGPASGQGAGTGDGAIGVDASQSISVGTSTTSATTKLLVVASSTASGEFALRVIQPGTGPLLVVRNDGNIGIATGTPGYTLAVQGNVYASGNITCGGSCGAGGGNVAAANVTPGGFNYGQPFGSSTGNYAFPASLGIGTSTTALPASGGFFAYQTSTFYGKVGIGTSTPDVKLHLYGASVGPVLKIESGLLNDDGSIDFDQNVTVSPNALGAIRFNWNKNRVAEISGLTASDTVNKDTGELTFWTRNDADINVVERVRIDKAGNVGIGTKQPSSTLHVIESGFSIPAIKVSNDAGGFYSAVGDTNNTDGGVIDFWFGAAETTPGYSRGFVIRDNTAGVNRFQIDPSGNVGIGTIQPSSTLHVIGGTRIVGNATTTNLSITGIAPASTQCLQISTTGAVSATGAACGGAGGSPVGANGAVQFASSTNFGGNASKFFWDNVNNRLGIGTSTPAYALTVVSPNNAYGLVNTNGTATIGTWLGQSSGVNVAEFGTFSNHRLDFFTNDSSAQLTIATSGNVGIGTVNPTVTLDVRNGVKAAVGDGTDIAWFGSTDASPIVLKVGIIGSSTARNQGIWIDAVEPNVSDDRPLVLNRYGGNVGIGTASPSATLQVGSGAVYGVPKVSIFGTPDTTVNSIGQILAVVDTSASGSNTTFGGINFQSGPGIDFVIGKKTVNNSSTAFQVRTNNAVELLTINSSGTVGIGTSTPAVKLQVIGDIRVGTSGTNGCVQNFAGTTIAGTSCVSDSRLKKDVVSLSVPLDKIIQLQPVSYRWKLDVPDMHFGDGVNYGLIADNVETVFPELVGKDEHGYKTFNYSALPIYELQAIKELKLENDSLKARIEALESKLK